MTPCDAVVFFGASGDLAYKKVLPALYRLVHRQRLRVPIIGVAKSDWDTQRLIQHARTSLDASRESVDAQAFHRLTSLLCYVQGDYTDPGTFERLREKLESRARPLFYMAIPPSLFDHVVRGLHESGCSRDGRLLVEKPFGHDLESARELNRVILRAFPEQSVFRIDHFLGKESVENLSYFRFANDVFDPIWHRHYVSSVQITMAEGFGVQGRGAFYDQTGAIRDVLQNHLLQVVATLAMDPVPHGGSLPEARSRLIRSIQPLDPGNVVRGQFAGYSEEAGVQKHSETETYCAVKLFVDSPRWAGVPFLIRAGKCLPDTVTEARVLFKRPPRPTLGDVVPAGATYLRYRLDPDVVIALGLRTKRPGEKMVGQQVELACHAGTAFNMTAYERLLGDALDGHGDLFALRQDVEAEWQVVDPVLHELPKLHKYEPGSWGPEQAQHLTRGVEPWYSPRAAESTTR